MSHNAAKLLAEASNCGIRITGLDGWTQTRLAEALHIRRETLNAIINQAPGSEPTVQRPRMVEACQKLITFAAALSAKEDAVLKLPVESGNLQSDDGQAYEHHRLRLHRLVEQAALDQHYTDAICRLGEFASAAVYGAPKYRLRMICNLVTAIQRLLDKPASREVPHVTLRANLGRLYRAERAARRIHRRQSNDAKVVEQSQYVGGQVGYGLIYSGMLLAEPRLVTRGGRRLFEAVARQPDVSYGHWSNLLRATNDLMASGHAEGQAWAGRLLEIARTQSGRGFARSYAALEGKGEIQRLRQSWNRADRQTIDRLVGDDRAVGAGSMMRATASAVALFVASLAAICYATPARGGDGRDFRSQQVQPTPQPQPQLQQVTPARLTAVTPTPTPTPASTSSTPGNSTAPGGRSIRRAGGGDAPLHVEANRRGPTDFSRLRVPAGGGDAPPDFDLRSGRFIPGQSAADIEPFSTDSGGIGVKPPTPSANGWGDNLQALIESAGPRPAPAVRHDLPAPDPKPTEAERARDAESRRAAIAAASTPDAKAVSGIAMARSYLAAGKPDAAQRKLQDVVANYPDTAAAAQAKVLLAQIENK